MASSHYQDIKAFQKLPENQICADCDAKESEWTSINLGIFMCIKCSGVHRSLGTDHSKVRSTVLDTTCWDEPVVSFMKSVGNKKAKLQYEYNAPNYYLRASETPNEMVRENWIKAKYVKKEFCPDAKVDPAAVAMPEAPKEGYLLKANMKKVWQKRYFILLGNALSYYKSPDSCAPQGTIPLKQIISVTVPDKADAEHKYTFIITTSQGRSYPVACVKDDELYSWVHALRKAMIYWKDQFAADSELKISTGAPFSSMKPIIRKGQATIENSSFFSTRFLVLNQKALYIFGKQPSDSDTPDLAISLKQCSVADAAIKRNKKFCFVLEKPDQQLFFSMTSQQESNDWMNDLKTCIEKHNPRTLYDFHVPSRPTSTTTSAKAAPSAAPSSFSSSPSPSSSISSSSSSSIHATSSPVFTPLSSSSSSISTYELPDSFFDEDDNTIPPSSLPHPPPVPSPTATTTTTTTTTTTSSAPPPPPPTSTLSRITTATTTSPSSSTTPLPSPSSSRASPSSHVIPTSTSSASVAPMVQSTNSSFRSPISSSPSSASTATTTTTSSLPTRPPPAPVSPPPRPSFLQRSTPLPHPQQQQHVQPQQQPSRPTSFRPAVTTTTSTITTTTTTSPPPAPSSAPPPVRLQSQTSTLTVSPRSPPPPKTSPQVTELEPPPPPGDDVPPPPPE
eukprot:TRINITY_DN2615_c0_g1_i1.p1 TRINITY_DN2615_c0_g1~~TRINITY_DN2615_c0_g1_i1.p1  ORF type:complete len:675 (-),score=214.80 TRINITY_DN2615_c0_g1_i1:418-2442(-)